MKLVASAEILTEVRETLSKQKLRLKFPNLTDERVELFLQRMGQIAELIHDVPSVFTLERDPMTQSTSILPWQSGRRSLLPATTTFDR